MPRPGCVRLWPRASGQKGFTLIEAVFAMVLFAGLAAAMAGLLTSAISANKLARQRTIADQAVLEHIEYIRRLPYDDVGTVAGNPPGVVNATTAVTLTGLKATITTQIRYVDDPTPTSYETTANYKRVTVTVRRNDDNSLLAREVTYVAPTSRTPFGGVNLAIIQPVVIDYGLNVPVEGANVNLATGPSAPRNDVTDSTGEVSFKKLTPNATPTCPSDCYDLTASLSGYVMLDAPMRINVGPGQTATPTLQIYRPATINIVLQNSSGGPFTSTTSVKLTSARDGATQTFSVTGGTAAITTLNGVQIVPSVQYTAEAWTTGTPLCATPTTKYVPDNYPTVMTSTYVLTMDTCPGGSIDVTVTWGGAAVNAATVTLSGGPYALNPVVGSTDASGQVSFTNVPSGSGYTVQATKSGQNAPPATNVTVTTGNSTPVSMALPTGTVVILVRNSGGSNQTNGAGTARIKLGPMNINVTGTTDSTGRVTFVNVPVGTGYTLQAWRTGCGGTGSKSRQFTSQTVNTGTNNFTLQWNNATCPLT